MRLTRKQNWRDIRGLTMARLVAREDQAERGQYADLQWFYFFMERSDVTLMSAIARRLAFLDSPDWQYWQACEQPVLVAERRSELGASTLIGATA